MLTGYDLFRSVSPRCGSSGYRFTYPPIVVDFNTNVIRFINNNNLNVNKNMAN